MQDQYIENIDNEQLIIDERIQQLRKEYLQAGLEVTEVYSDPMRQFELWFDEAVKAELPEPNAMTLATATPDGMPSARIVLLKGIRQNGFWFFTNYESRKGKELQNNDYAAVVFFWQALERQVRIEGRVVKISQEESQQYFNTRPRASQIGAWTSPQSTPIPDRAYLENIYQSFEQKFANEATIPVPPHWGGYVLIPHYFEFWQGRQSRLHDRIIYHLVENSEWKISRLAP